MEIFQIILAGIAGLGISYEIIKKWKKLKWGKRALAIIGIGLVIVTAWNGIIEFNKNNFLAKINASYGDIEDIEDATLPTIGFGMPDSVPRFVLDVTGTLHWSWNNLDFTNLFKVYIKNNKLYINIIVYDSAGAPVLGIFENTWKVYNNNFEYNYDNQAIEIVTNAEHLVLFHVELRNGVAHIEGFLYTQKSNINRINGIKGIKIFKDSYGAGITQLTDKIGIDTSITPLFKYPKEKYLGVRVRN